MTTDRDGWLQLDGWAGRTQQRVRVIGETPKRIRIRAIADTRLAGARRIIKAGEIALVPKRAISPGPISGVARA